MDDPDLLELEEALSIGIFEPGTLLESEINNNQILGVLGYTALGMILMVVTTFLMMVPLMMTSLIIIDISTFYVYIDPLAVLILTFGEISLVIPPMYYIRKRGLPKSAIGIKNMVSAPDAILGIIFGIVMIGVNIAIAWVVEEAIGPTAPGVEGLLIARNWPEMFAWIFTMVVFVGFTEELIFRGFMQRRMEMYFRGRRTSNYKIVALLISSFIFGAIHLDVLGLPIRFILGVFLGFLAQQRNYNILGPSLAHGINNAVVVFLSSIPFLF